MSSTTPLEYVTLSEGVEKNFAGNYNKNEARHEKTYFQKVFYRLTQSLWLSLFLVMALEADALGHRHSSTGKSTSYMHLERLYKKVDNFERFSISQIRSFHEFFDKYRWFGYL